MDITTSHTGNESIFGVAASGGLSTLISIAQAAINDHSSKSLSEYTKQCQISSTVYIERHLLQEEVLPDVLNIAQQLYISWIFAAVNLNNYIDGTKTKVKEALNVVASEKFYQDLNRVHIPTEDLINGLETFTSSRFATTPAVPANSTPKYPTNHKLEDKEVKLPAGRQIELKFSNGTSAVCTVNLYPQFIDETVYQQFFKLGRTETIGQRWFKYRTGEYSFWRDFVFELDKANDLKEALKKDDTGVLLGMKQKTSSTLSAYLYRLFTGMQYLKKAIDNGNYGSSGLKQNLINSILVLDKADFDRWCRETNTNFKSESDRNKFMVKTGAMMVIILDGDFQTLTMYYHGIKNFGEYTYKQVTKQAKSETYDLVSLMKAFSAGTSAKF